MRITQLIKDKDYGQRIAVSASGIEISYDVLYEAVEQITRYINNQPFMDEVPTPRIGVMLPSGLAYIVVGLGILNSGACFIPVPDELSINEQEDLLSTTAAHAVIELGSNGLELIYDLGEVSIRVLERRKTTYDEVEFGSLNPAFIRFSSGTTSRSKGVVLSHESLLERIVAANEALNISPDEKVLWTLPMAHHFVVSVILYLYHGATTILSDSQDADDILRLASEHKVSVMYGSPFHYARLLQNREEIRLPHLRLAISTAAKLSAEVAGQFYNRFSVPITQALGVIEVGLPIVNIDNAEERPEAIGRVLSSYRYRIESESNQNIGELWLKGKGMFDAYLVPWKTREEISVDGWFCTGDLVEEISPGLLILRGRSKSVINVGGMKVFPEEVETIINEYEGIAYSKVWSEEHYIFGAYPVASYVLEAGTDKIDENLLLKFCKGRLSSYKIPIRYECVDEISTTASGKIKRY